MLNVKTNKWFVLVTSLVLIGCWAYDTSKRGPFDPVWKHVDDCGDEKALLRFHIRSRKVSRTAIKLEGYMFMKASEEWNVTELNDDVKVKSVAQQFTPNGWKDNFYIVDFGDVGVCSLWEKHFEPNEIARFSSGVLDENKQPLKVTCPLHTGNYTVSGIDMGLQFSNKSRFPKSFFYGNYRFMVHLYNLDRSHELGCISFYLDVVPKRKNG